MACLLPLLPTKTRYLLLLQSSNLADQSDGYTTLGSMGQGIKICKAYLQDSTGNWGGSLILSTTTAGSTSSSSGQPVDRLTIDSSGLATFTAGQTHCLLGSECVQVEYWVCAG